MQVLVNSDNHIEASQDLISSVGKRVGDKIKRFEEHLTRVEIHLRDENAHKAGGNDKRCLIEARPKGRDPISVSHNADHLEQAIEGAISKLIAVLERDISKTRAN